MISRSLRVHSGEWSFPSGLALVSFCSLTTLSASLPPSFQPFIFCSVISGFSYLSRPRAFKSHSLSKSLSSLAYSLPPFWNYPPSLLWQKTSLSRIPVYFTVVELTTLLPLCKLYRDILNLHIFTSIFPKSLWISQRQKSFLSCLWVPEFLEHSKRFNLWTNA